MTRILVQRGSSSSSSSSSNPNRTGSLPNSSLPSSSTTPVQHQLPSSSTTTPLPSLKDDQIEEEVQQRPCLDDSSEDPCMNADQVAKTDDICLITYPQDSSDDGPVESEKIRDDDLNLNTREVMKEGYGLQINEEDVGVSNVPVQITSSTSYPPPPPVPPPKLSPVNTSARLGMSGTLNSQRSGSSRRATAWPVVSARSSPNGSRPSSPRSHCENEGYNSADEQGPCFVSSYNDTERERQFEIDIRRVKGFELRRMLEDGNCLFRAVADQVYGDSELHDLVRQMCIDYMEQERDHFSQFMTEGFTSYIQRKRRNKVYGNNIEIQALAEMYNRPIHIYCYSTEPINIFHGSYNTDVPPIRLSFHSGNHYNSLVDPRRLAIGAGLGFSSLQGRNIDRDQVKAAIKAQQDQQIDNALLAEGRFYSDLELTEKEMERMVMEASRAEYLTSDKFNQQSNWRQSSTPGAEPSSSGGARSSGSETAAKVLSSSVQMVLSMGFSYMQAMEAYSIFGDDVDSMICYLIETGNSSRQKGKARE
ncbi:OVARIAN TUMOR DOMAIN-containing deubiquitinating enzyme 6 [Impatiens glandulifera]|uniref:OVARIAN TUMOR DOMAIN-containing deubiquitinating enzyme 6 n=1 Tax=Impatiens glandulifera TaxID=253017 RepID=UPI001FB16420|nr:OVARIAN TUMOR DOMAIN-containing deubiquitinating enzyme 6 [Impatiens glandulifera]XP_047325508.1 OVARIAN TUMOR DOMAIN-containing deubiquitinating enzyme 6 [Impatiens glandulifera]XP_047325509.1 OVARIAN TUMOR DOMAIN-containing deubiquitinating enzyme 6 [Impatiens glandulifera]XP_047325510.1 OVARIAN TUMOR DOMAIN-containing deubiquitinating enzyme 6 [Impatiens glandulifera]XP_047325511.1 OVARIAN TUMOR DOMAIN-containing deubiquitinating enzyme 6 [Impatiens glandulifera]XP_047325512.1 OVARIAN TU